MPVSFQIVIFALIAAFVLFQLYNVLGRRVGRQPEDNKPRTPLPAAPGADQPAVPKTPGVDAATLAAIAGLKARDPAFDPVRFLEGARQAYETIVRGYAAGDRAAGATAYVTLEPCGARSSGRKSCAHFLTEAGVAAAVIVVDLAVAVLVAASAVG